MFASFTFGIAQNPDVGLHCPTSFGTTGWQSCNMPMERTTISSSTNVVCAILCYVEFKDCSMHAPLPLVFGRRVKYSTSSY